MDDFLEFIVMKIIAPLAIFLVLVGLIFIIIILPIAYYQDSHDPHKSLNMKDWFCSRDHEETMTTMVMAGKVMVPMTTTQHVCDQYNRGN